MHTIFEQNGHKNVFFSDLTGGAMVQANQHVIIDGDQAMVLDPGGHKVFSKLFSEVHGLVPPAGLKTVVLSHQDPDIVAAINGWLMATDITAYAPDVWTRFIPHFGVDELVMDRIVGVGDGGRRLSLNGKPILLIPAHFVHSSGNLQVYDPTAKILYSGDLGVSVGTDTVMVEDFEHHIQFMKAFHQRYMPTTKALKMWVNTVRQLDIEIIAPQHGAVFGNRELVGKLIDWVDGLQCGADLMGDSFEIPA